jgi:hypothetical protein
MQQLTLQDVMAGEFKDPYLLANPLSHDMIATQQQKLFSHPERYSGYLLDGKLVAYAKQGEWKIGDELPFASGLYALLLRVRQALGVNLSLHQRGVFGLVASKELNESDQRYVLADLLRRSLRSRRTAEYHQVINIVLHENDPLLEIATDFGFKAVGKQGDAAGAPGLKQQRYQRRA